MEDSILVARELGRLTEAVGSLKVSVDKMEKSFADETQAMGHRLTKLENRYSMASGVIWTIGGIVTVLGVDRLLTLALKLAV